MKPMLEKTKTVLIVLVLTLLFLPTLNATADDIDDIRELLDESRLTFSRFVEHPTMVWLKKHIHDAKGIFIAPALTEGGYILGGALGKGMLLLRDEQSGQWSEPAFYQVTSASFGFQIGVSRSEVLVLIMTSRGIESLLKTSFILGPGLKVAVGPIGRGVSGGVSSSLAADFITFARSKGAMIKLSLGGTLLRVWTKAHEIYYGKEVAPEEIVLSQKVSNWYSARFRKAVTEATGSKWVTSKKSILNNPHEYGMPEILLTGEP